MSVTIEKNNIIRIGLNLIEKIESIAQNHFYTTDSELYYEDHTPFVAYLIKSGQGKLFKKRRKDIPLGPGDLIGLKELVCHEPSIYGASIGAESTLIFIDRSTIFEIIEEEVDKDLKTLFESFLIEA